MVKGKLLQVSTGFGKVNALLDRAGQFRHALLQGILLIRAEPTRKAVHLLNTCSRHCHECLGAYINTELQITLMTLPTCMSNLREAAC